MTGPVKRGLSIPVSQEMLRESDGPGHTRHWEPVSRRRLLANWWSGWLYYCRERMALRLAPWLDEGRD